MPYYPEFPQDWDQTLTEQINLEDSKETTKLFYQVLIESINLSDNLEQDILKILTEQINLNDINEQNVDWVRAYTEILRIDDGDVKDVIERTLIESVQLDDAISKIKGLQNFKTLSETLDLNDSYGKPNQIFVYVYDTATSTWTEVEGIQYFKVEKRLNQMSKFEIDMPQIEADQKLYVKEFAKVLLISDNKLILKGRIQKVTYETSYSAKIEGFGMEATVLDQEYKNIIRNPEDEDRVQYDNVSAQNIAKELLSSSLNTELISYWKLDETSGTIAIDSCGKNNGTFSGTITQGVAGKINTCYNFIGSGQIEANSAATNIGPNISVSCWISPQAITDDDGRIFDLTTIDNLNRIHLTREKGAGNQIIYAYVNGNSTSYNTSVGVWYHVIVTYDGANLKLYVNGNLEGTVADSSFVKIVSGIFRIGNNSDGFYPRRYKGLLDEVGLWNRALTSSEVAELYNSGNGLSLDSLSSWIMPPRNYGLFTTDYGLISMRYEYANRLTALGNLASAISYDWWIDHDPLSYANDYFNMASIKGNQIDPAGDANRQFTITGANTNAEGTNYQKDITNIANFVKVLGYAEGINQLFTFTYQASPIWTTLSANISETDATISLVDSSAFAASGTVRIAEEVITYTGNVGNQLTGCTRAAGGTTAKIHRKGCYIEKYVLFIAPEAASSIYVNGLMELTLTYKDVRDESTLELIASKELIDRMNPIERITLTPIEPYTVAETLETGDLISIIDAESSLNSNYRVVGIIYENNYGDLSVTLEASNKSLTFIEQMQKEREKNQSLQKYMQGATNVYVVSNSENCDSGYGCIVKTYIPADAIAINHVKLSYDVSAYRIYNTTTANESAHTHGIPSLTVNGTTTSANTSGSSTPTATSGVSVWATYTESVVKALGYVERNSVGSPTLYISRYETLMKNTTGGTVTVNGTIETLAATTLTQGDTSLGNNSVLTFNSGESDPTYEGYFKCYDGNYACSSWCGMADVVYSHTHGSHTHSIPTLTVLGTSTVATTSNAGSAHNHGVNYGISTGTNTITDMQIYIDGSDRTAAIETQIGHTLSINSTESDIDITQWITTTGAWHTIDVRPNGTCRIQADMWNQIFIESI
jgi:hypothetical protein